MNHYLKLSLFVILIYSSGCKPNAPQTNNTAPTDDFQYFSEQFADLKVLRYQIPGFEKLDSKQKELLYYLYQAALSGRDIIWDQNYKHNLLIRRTLEAVQEKYTGDRNSQDFKNFEIYCKRVWFSNGIHHHYSNMKFIPEISPEYFATLIKETKADFPKEEKQSLDEFIKFITPLIFDPNVATKRLNQDAKQDMITTSAGNYYEGVTQKEAEAYYSSIIDKKDHQPISYGLNSKMVKEKGKVTEKVWKVGGMYGQAIEKIVFWLEKAVAVAENDVQKKTLQLLVDFYKTGSLKTFDEYNISWVQDTAASVDVVNGFIEVYGDPLGYKAAYESVVSFKDMEATKRIDAISKNAQWFEDNSPLIPEHKKKNVTGISAKVITVVVESGDASPTTPIGINLPNAEWIRKEHGSKSVNLGNIVNAYDESAKSSGMLQEFAASEEEMQRTKQYGALSSKLHTDMHEVIGHASGQINPGIGTPKETLKSYASCLEEARADLVALYYIYDQKLIDIGVLPNFDASKAEYDGYIRNGLMTQLVRIKEGEEIEEAHMRNRQLIAKWVFEKGSADKVIEKITQNNKTYFVVRDYAKLRTLFGQLLREIQRIKSEGDYKAGKDLVENYGVKVDAELHKEVLERYKKLNIAPYAGFINPKLVPVEQNGKIVDVKVEYPADFTKQMLEYAKEYSFLPTQN
ncbi:MAG: dipeptidyl peptidase 3 [Bacteroidia bacterium]|nr:dipeptidyl peptidase 3 [Bacteroidia bacterium]